jgi:hypothetical protein
LHETQMAMHWNLLKSTDLPVHIILLYDMYIVLKEKMQTLILGLYCIHMMIIQAAIFNTFRY